MQGIIFKSPDVLVARDFILPVYINGIIACNFKIESFDDNQVIGDFTTNVEPNLQFTIAKDGDSLIVVPVT